jgi:uncharacterized protein YdeI (YjbR/CyaY-like superfamily)
VRPTVTAARRMVKQIAPRADEIPYRGSRPKSTRAMWKLVRYAIDGENIAGIGAYATYATLFFYRGRELDDGDGLLQGSGKDSRFVTLRSPAEAQAPAVKKLLQRAFRMARED